MYRNNQKYMPNKYGSYTRQNGTNTYSSNDIMNSNKYTSQMDDNNNQNNNEIRLPPVIINPDYLQGYLRKQIGKFMKVNFLLGNSTFIDKNGILKEVGVDHIVLRDIKSDEDVVADLYSIKFVEIPDE